ncbi:hypothetical protein D3C86_1887020 [compost metagenome]
MAKTNFNSEFLFQDVNRFLGIFRVYRETYRMLRRSLRNQDHADGIVGKSSEKAPGNTGDADHPATLDIHQRDLIDRRNTRDHIFLTVSRLLNISSFEARIECIKYF